MNLPARHSWFPLVIGAVLIVLSLPLLAGGLKLVQLGGSPYYILAGVGCLLSGVLIARLKTTGVWIYIGLTLVTIVWALWEVHLDFFQLLPRLAAPLVIAIPVVLCFPFFEGSSIQRKARLTGSLICVSVLGLVAVAAAAYSVFPRAIVASLTKDSDPIAVNTASIDQHASTDDWLAYGHTPAGTRYVPFKQITPENVSTLKAAWMFRMGDADRATGDHEATPLQVGNVLYVCSPSNVVFALAADTGKQLWRFDPHVANLVWPRCRGVGYYDSHAVSSSNAACARRVITSTLDDQLIALDAESGKPCEDFANHGIADLKSGMGEIKLGYHFPTAAPTVMRNLILVGGLVWDNVEVGMPSGVIRAYNAQTGALAWAWDLGSPSNRGEPPPGKTYTRATPNMWSAPSFDDKLGLVYVPLGVATPDFWGSTRTKESEEYGNSLVALDISTGVERWHFQGVHHDLWDSDLPPQPALYDIPDGHGGKIPAVIQGGKTGQIFVLDRRDGKPITEVKELPVPQGGLPDDYTSPTQPFSVGMPAIGTKKLTEANMWGATPLDQLWCRIRFRELRYEGQFTPPTTKSTLMYPGYYGGMNWGGVAVDEGRGYLIVNDIRIPLINKMLTRAEADRRLEQDKQDAAKGAQTEFSLVDRSGMFGTPYGDNVSAFMSPLNIPCNAPPWGTLTAIDLSTRQIAWQIPMGTTHDIRLHGIKVGVPVALGMPTLSGPLATQSGLVFFSGTQDYYLRAMDVRSGEELWKARLPVGSQATPMSYISPKSGQQYVAVVAGGVEHSDDKGDYIIAYSLPQNK